MLWTTLPVTTGGILHMLIVRAGWMQAWAIPLDGGRCWRGQRILGDHKTWRGLLVIVIGTMVMAGGQRLTENAAPWLAGWNLTELRGHGWWHAGLVMGTGYALAELPNSFFKRRLGIAPGQGRAGATGLLLVLLDQADSALGVAAAGRVALGWDGASALRVAAVCTILHLAVNASLGAARVRRRAL